RPPPARGWPARARRACWSASPRPGYRAVRRYPPPGLSGLAARVPGPPDRRPSPAGPGSAAGYESLKLHLRRLLGVLGGGLEVLAKRHVAVHQCVPDASGEGADLGVVALHRRDEVASRHGDAVLGTLQLRLQGEE